MKSSLIFDAASVLAGQATRPVLVIIGAIIGVLWIGMDVHQYIDMLIDKFSSHEFPFPV